MTDLGSESTVSRLIAAGYNYGGRLAKVISSESDHMTRTSLAFLKEQIELNDQLLAGRKHIFHPQDLPGRYGRAVRAVDHLLQVIECEAVLGGGWAVWHHGFAERLTQDLDIAWPAERIDAFLRVATVAGFNIIPRRQGRWPPGRGSSGREATGRGLPSASPLSVEGFLPLEFRPP